MMSGYYAVAFVTLVSCLLFLSHGVRAMFIERPSTGSDFLNPVNWEWSFNAEDLDSQVVFATNGRSDDFTDGLTNAQVTQTAYMINKVDLATGRIRESGPSSALVDDFEVDLRSTGHYNFNCMSTHPITGNLFTVSSTYIIRDVLQPDAFKYFYSSSSSPQQAQPRFSGPRAFRHKVLEVNVHTGNITEHGGFTTVGLGQFKGGQGVPDCTFTPNGNFYLSVSGVLHDYDVTDDGTPWEEKSQFGSSFGMESSAKYSFLTQCRQDSVPAPCTDFVHGGVVRWDFDSQTFQKLPGLYNKLANMAPHALLLEYYPALQNFLMYKVSPFLVATQGLEYSSLGLSANTEHTIVSKPGIYGYSTSSFMQSSYSIRAPNWFLGGAQLNAGGSYSNTFARHSFRFTSYSSSSGTSQTLGRFAEPMYALHQNGDPDGYIPPISSSWSGSSYSAPMYTYNLVKEAGLTHWKNTTFLSWGFLDQGIGLLNNAVDPATGFGFSCVPSWFIQLDVNENQASGATPVNLNGASSVWDALALERNLGLYYAPNYNGACNVRALAVLRKPVIDVLVDDVVVISQFKSLVDTVPAFPKTLQFTFTPTCEHCALEKQFELEYTMDSSGQFSQLMNVVSVVNSTVEHTVVLEQPACPAVMTTAVSFPIVSDLTVHVRHSLFEANVSMSIPSDLWDTLEDCRCGGDESQCNVTAVGATVTCDANGSNVMCSACNDGWIGDACDEMVRPVLICGAPVELVTPVGQETVEVSFPVSAYTVIYSGIEDWVISQNTSYESGDSFPIGTEHILWTITLNETGFTDNCTLIVTVVDFDECISDPCLNNGTCINNVEDVITCNCTSGWTGSFCEASADDCISDPCLNNGTCINNAEDAFTCNCTSGWTGSFCEADTDDCASSPCDGEGVSGCFDLGTNVFECKCNDGYSGDLCTVCSTGFAGASCGDPVVGTTEFQFTLTASLAEIELLEDAVDEAIAAAGVDDSQIDYALSFLGDDAYVVTVTFYQIAGDDEIAVEADFIESIQASVIGTNVGYEEPNMIEGGAVSVRPLDLVVGASILSLVSMML